MNLEGKDLPQPSVLYNWGLPSQHFLVDTYNLFTYI